MAAATDIFSKNNEKQIAEKIISNIQNGDLHEISHGLCNVRDNSIILDYRYFKHFASKDTYNYIMTNVTTHINNIISSHDKFVVHVNIKSLTVLEVDKHKLFIQFFSNYLQENYPNKMHKCYVHNPPFVFSQIFNMVSMFIDKETQNKIEIVK
jgi:hypothetical protein